MRLASCERCAVPFVRRKWNQRFCSENCRKRQHEEASAQRALCLDCGTALSEGSRYKSYKRCQPCERKRQTERMRPRTRLIEKLWAEGVPRDEIGRILGWTPGHITNELDRLRKRGANVPSRYAAVRRRHGEAA